MLLLLEGPDGGDDGTFRFFLLGLLRLLLPADAAAAGGPVHFLFSCFGDGETISPRLDDVDLLPCCDCDSEELSPRPVLVGCPSLRL